MKVSVSSTFQNFNSVLCLRLELRILKYLFLFSIKAKGWYSHNPAHSCKDIRDSGNSKGDGEYWIDPENNGNPLKVYCDMTTDEGEMKRKQVTREKLNLLIKFVLHKANFATQQGNSLEILLNHEI